MRTRTHTRTYTYTHTHTHTSPPPQSNRLVLVAREPSVLSFVKYVARSAATECRYDLALQFAAEAEELE